MWINILFEIQFPGFLAFTNPVLENFLLCSESLCCPLISLFLSHEARMALHRNDISRILCGGATLCPKMFYIWKGWEREGICSWTAFLLASITALANFSLPLEDLYIISFSSNLPCPYPARILSFLPNISGISWKFTFLWSPSCLIVCWF